MNQGSLPVVVLFLLAGVGAAGCQTPTDPALTPGDATALRAALTAYVDAANTGEAARWAGLYAEDAVVRHFADRFDRSAQPPAIRPIMSRDA